VRFAPPASYSWAWLCAEKKTVWRPLLYFLKEDIVHFCAWKKTKNKQNLKCISQVPFFLEMTISQDMCLQMHLWMRHFECNRHSNYFPSDEKSNSHL
jgi:hypothetical protein